MQIKGHILPSNMNLLDMQERVLLKWNVQGQGPCLESCSKLLCVYPARSILIHQLKAHAQIPSLLLCKLWFDKLHISTKSLYNAAFYATNDEGDEPHA